MHHHERLATRTWPDQKVHRKLVRNWITSHESTQSTQRICTNDQRRNVMQHTHAITATYILVIILFWIGSLVLTHPFLHLLRKIFLLQLHMVKTCKIGPSVKKPVQKKLRRLFEGNRFKVVCRSFAVYLLGWNTPAIVWKKPSTTLISWLGPCHLGILCTASCTWPCKQVRIQDTFMGLLASNIGKWDKEEVWWRQGWQDIRLSEVLARCFQKTMHQSYINQSFKNTTTQPLVRNLKCKYFED